MSRHLGLMAISLVLVLGACERRWKGDHVEPLKPMPPSEWQLRHGTDPKAQAAALAAEERAESEARRRAYQQARDAAPDCDPERFRFRPNDRLTAAESATLVDVERSAEIKLADGRPAHLFYRQFDYEETPARGDMRGIATVYARLDTGQTVGGVLWGWRGPDTPYDIGEFKTSAKGMDLLLSQHPDTDIGPDGGERIVCVGRFRLHLDPQGVLTAQGVRVGALP